MGDNRTNDVQSYSLTLVNVCKKYDRNVLSNVSLQIAKDTVTSIIGKSGSGKTTLLRLVGGYEEPDSGEVRYSGSCAQPGTIAYMTQESALFPWLTVAGHLSLPEKLGVSVSNSSRSRVERIAELTGLNHYFGYQTNEISGGFRRILCLCMQMLLSPRLLLLDEPFSGLDDLTRERVVSEFTDIWTQEPITTLLVTHSAFEAVAFSDSIMVLSSKTRNFAAKLEIENPRCFFGRNHLERSISTYADEVRSMLLQSEK